MHQQRRHWPCSRGVPCSAMQGGGTAQSCSCPLPPPLPGCVRRARQAEGQRPLSCTGDQRPGASCRSAGAPARVGAAAVSLHQPPRLLHCTCWQLRLPAGPRAVAGGMCQLRDSPE